MKLVRLIYASELYAPLAKNSLQQILSAADRNNAQLGITGYLCVSPQYALQCLEGPREPVNRLYNAIASDSRHKNVTLLRYAEPWRRLFPGWYMGHSNELSSAASKT
jgi:hypothetical protein